MPDNTRPAAAEACPGCSTLLAGRYGEVSMGDVWTYEQQHRAVFPGDEAGVRAARAWLESYLEGHQRRDDIATVAAELCSNAIRHTVSRGEQFALSVEYDEAGTGVMVEDNGSADSKPERRAAGPEDMHGHGLALVEELTDTWCVDGGPHGRDVWAWWNA